MQNAEYECKIGWKMSGKKATTYLQQETLHSIDESDKFCLQINRGTLYSRSKELIVSPQDKQHSV